jgi:RNA polymerase sigma-70 factor (ECF subfamily)
MIFMFTTEVVTPDVPINIGGKQEYTDNISENPILDDIQLMALVKEGNKDAFRKIIQHHEIPLLNFFRRLGADIDRAEECIQDTFIKLYNYRKKYTPSAKFTTFLYTLARHSWADECRRWKRNKSKESVELIEFKESVDCRLDIQDAINKLSDKLRVTMVLSVYQGLNYEEISEVLKIPVGTVKSRMFSAFGELREILKDDK